MTTVNTFLTLISRFTSHYRNPFSYLSTSDTTHGLEDLCAEMGFAKDILHCATKHGGNNTIIIFECTPLGKQFNHRRICCVLRIKKVYNISNRQEFPVNQSVKMLVALTHQFGRSGVGLPIPDVLAYDSTFENPIGCPYIVQELVGATTLYRLCRTMNRFPQLRGPTDKPHLVERCHLARQIAEFIAKKESYSFPGYGVIRNASDLPTDDPEVLAARYDLSVAQIRIVGKNIPTEPEMVFLIGELVFARLRKTSPQNMDERIKAGSLVTMWRNMLKRGPLMAQPSILWHPDFHPRNIMLDTDEEGHTVLKGVIDWDNCMALPRIMTREPPSFLWENKSASLSKRESESIKTIFDETIEALLPGYIEDAYSTNGVLVRALGMYALFGFNWAHHHELSFEKLVEGYEKLFPRECSGQEFSINRRDWEKI